MMAYNFTPTFGTGWETGSPAEESSSGAQVVSTLPKTGSYHLFLGSSGSAKYWETDAVPSAGIYVAFWACPNRANIQAGQYQVKIGGSYFVELRFDTQAPGGVWSAYVNSVKVATGSIILAVAEYHHVQMYVHTADVGGRILTKIDGLSDITYTGDTSPAGGPTIQSFRIYSPGGSSGVSPYVDDLVIGYGDGDEDDWPGDYRFDALLVQADSAVQWTPSAGANWQCIDERPPSEADYVSTVTNAHKDKYTLTDWDATNKVAQFVVTWVYAKKDDASISKIKLVLDDGVENIGPGQDLLTTADYVRRIDLTKPSGGAWNDAALDALVAGFQAEIPA